MRFADQALIVLGAQMRMYRNLLGRRGAAATVFNIIATGGWYLLAVFVAYLAGAFFANTPEPDLLLRLLVVVLLGIVAYWQFAPIFTVSFGLALDLKRLLIYPIRPNQYFLMELVLCLPTSIEALCVTIGVTFGLLLNPTIPAWRVLLVSALFLTFNLFLNVAIRALVSKIAVKKIWRELVVVFILVIVITPQFLLSTSGSDTNWLERILQLDPYNVLPWSAAASAYCGLALPASMISIGVWALLALAGARGLFFRSLHGEEDAGLSRGKAKPDTRKRADIRATAAAALGWLFPQPLSSLVEKEFLTFARSPRFLTVFVMGFTFGIVVFLPMAMRTDDVPGFTSRNFLSIVSAYAILLMSETAFWNVFGLDRKAAQLFFFAPVPLQSVFIAKNIVAFAIVCFQVFMISLVCSAIGVPVTLAGIAEAAAAAIVLAINMFAVGNQSSVRYPAGVNPDQSWSTANKAKFRLVLMLLFPLISLPTTLAYLARFAFDSDAAFYVGMLIAGSIALVFYLVSLDSAIGYARNHREELVDLLGSTETAT